MSQSPSEDEVREAEAQVRECRRQLDKLAQDFGDVHFLRAIAEYTEEDMLSGALENWRKTYNPQGLDVDSDPAHFTAESTGEDDGD